MVQSEFSVCVVFRNESYEVKHLTPQMKLYDFQLELADRFHISLLHQKLILQHKGQPSHQLNHSKANLSLEQIPITPNTRLLLLGSSDEEINQMKQDEQQMHMELQIRETRKQISLTKLNEHHQRLTMASRDYGFQTIQVLSEFSDAEKAKAILTSLANDRGILAVMKKYKWNVGALEEMYPSGKVGVDPVCVLGLNENKGQKILLRLRTDDLKGFRKFLSIKNVLFHELAHNVHSGHGNDFYMLMRKIERESVELDWSASQGHATGGSNKIHHVEMESKGHVLGGSTHSHERIILQNSMKVNSPPINLSLVQKQGSEADSKTVSKLNPEIGTVEQFYDEKVAAKVSSPKLQPAVNSNNLAIVSDGFRSNDEMFYEKSSRELRIENNAQLVQQICGPETKRILLKIIENLIKSPTDQKFRRLKFNTKMFSTYIEPYFCAMDYLRALGFEETIDSSSFCKSLVITRDDPGLLWIGKSYLSK